MKTLLQIHNSNLLILNSLRKSVSVPRHFFSIYASAIISRLRIKGRLYNVSDNLALVAPLPSVFYMSGPKTLIAAELYISPIFKELDEMPYAMRSAYISWYKKGVIKPTITRVSYDGRFVLPCFTYEYHESLALVPHEFIRYEKFISYIYDTLGWNIKNTKYTVLASLNRIMHTYSSSRGYGFIVMKPKLLLHLSYILTNKLFILIGPVRIRRVYNDIVDTLPSVIYQPGPVEKFGALVPLGFWEESRLLSEKNLTLIRENLKAVLTYNRWIGNIKQLSLLDRFVHYRFNTFKDISFVYEDLLHIINTLKNIHLSVGYVKTSNVFDKTVYPIFSEALGKFMDKESWSKSNNLERTKIYKWVMNILILTILKHVKTALKTLELLKVNINSEHVYYAEYIDIVSKYNILGQWCFKNLDNSLKQHLIKRNPQFTQETLSALDTEYVPENFGINKLLSVQTSTSGLLKLFIPIYKPFVFEGVNTLTNETFILSAPKFKFTTYSIDYINLMLHDIRVLTFGHLDTCLIALANSFGKHGDVDTIRKNETGILFVFKKYSIVNNIFLGAPGEQLKVSFKTLIASIRNTINFDYQMNMLFDRISSLKFFNDKTILVEDKAAIPWNGKTLRIKESLETILSNEDNAQDEHLKNSPLCKKFVYVARDVGFDNTKITFNVTRNLYLYGHYNAADLSMLDGFIEIVKRNIDILKKSYVSLTVPIKTLGENVYIRDTSLLASAVANTLKSIGQAHGLHKLEVGPYITRMGDLLMEKPGLFKAYAIQDSLITIIHALFMVDFASKLGSRKNPVTLGSLASKYLEIVWRNDNYRGYQIDQLYPLGDAQKTHTPKGVSSLGIVGESLNLFLGAFRGGRNECFAYGIDTKEKWFDYDLTSCYSTVMSMLGDPIYADGLNVGQQEESLPSFVPLSDNVHRNKISNLRPSDLVNLCSSGVGHQLPSCPVAPSGPSGEGGGLGGGNLSSSSAPAGFDSEVLEMGRLFPGISTLCGHPDYNKTVYINSNMNSFKDIDFKQGYSALRVEFNFPESIKYPPLPVSLDKDITIYPSSGSTLVTGLEYLSALNILNLCLQNGDYRDAWKYKIKVLHGVFIPFATEIIEDVKVLKYKPFYNVIKDLQANRAQWRKLTGKGSAMERIYKDLGNMLYGKVVSGISNKTSYDVRSESMKSMTCNYLTNPILGSWITGFVRSLLSELLFVSDQLGGKVTAVTTDGFVCNIENLEAKVMEYLVSKDLYKDSFLKMYRDIRVSLSSPDTPEALEIKTSVKGLAQWTTRGQMSLNVNDICAMTGFQKHLFTFNEIMSVLTSTLGKGNKMMFLQNRLTGALDHYKFGSDVSMLCSLRVYRTVFDSKRLIIQLEGDDEILFSKPFVNTQQALLFRTMIKQLRTSVYSASYTEKSTFVTTNNIRDEALKYFIRVCLEFLNWKPSINQKFDILEIIKLAKIKKSDESLMLMINQVLFNKGVIMNKLNYYKDSAELIIDFYSAVQQSATFNSLNNSIFLRLFYERFVNFFPSPSLQLVEIKTTNPFEENYLSGIEVNNSISKIIDILALLPENSQCIAKNVLNCKIPIIPAKTMELELFTILENEIEILENEIEISSMELELLTIEIEISKWSLTYVLYSINRYITEDILIIENLIDIVHDNIYSVETELNRDLFFLLL